MKKVLIVDNKDSFTFNIANALDKFPDCNISVRDSASLSIRAVAAYDKIILSPGPGKPEDFPLLYELLDTYKSSKSILGICLGHQALCTYFGASLKRLQQVIHGQQQRIKLSPELSNSSDKQPDHYLYAGLPPSIQVGLYHSWVVETSSLPTDLQAMAFSEQGLLMAVSHRSYDLHGLQFHPESFLSPQGEKILRNFLNGRDKLNAPAQPKNQQVHLPTPPFQHQTKPKTEKPDSNTNAAKFKKLVSDYALAGKPFLFLIDFKAEKPFACLLSEAEEHGLFFDFRGLSEHKTNKAPQPNLKIRPVDRAVYSTAFQKVVRHIGQGDTYLLNLTFPSEISVNASLEELFQAAQAPYKLYKKDEFVVFSPESFVRMRNGFLYTYPMKGTIDAEVENAEKKLLNNEKEIWEHNTIVDLLRNDLSLVARHVVLTRYRYVERIRTNRGSLLQTSSEIRGQLPPNWKEQLGELLLKLLPAGSVSGAPKQKTVEIIEKVEERERGYYTGVFGWFDGKNLDSAVSIRFIEKRGNKLYYRSGGGITFQSHEEEEYRELIHKIYVPSI